MRTTSKYRRTGSQPRRSGGGGKPLETNPWFGYYMVRDGRNSALFEALSIGRETMTTPGPDCATCSRPTWFRPLVGAYTCYACQPGEMLAGAPPVPDVPVHIPDHVELDPADIEVTYDKLHRDVIVIPDDVARIMRARIQQGWREFRGQADGESVQFREGHWMYTITRAILAAYAASPVPTYTVCQRPTTDDDIRRAERNRVLAGYELPWACVFIVGRSGWDAETHWWAGDVGEQRDLHVSSPYPHVDRRSPDSVPYVQYRG